MSRWTLADISRKPALSAQIYPAPVSAPPLAGKSPRTGLETPKRAKRRNDESDSQQALMKWWAVACHELRIPEELLMAFPLQSNRHIRNAVRMKREGCRAGTPDVLLAVPRGDCCGLWIEMKSPTGYLKPHQKHMLKLLTDHGAATVCCRSTQEAIAAITGYLLKMGV